MAKIAVVFFVLFLFYAVGETSDVFETGSYRVKNFTVGTSNASRPPVELLIVSPVTRGTYPVLLFCHGFWLINNWYTDLLRHIASHGYIVVAPQFYAFPNPMTNVREIRKAAKVAGWITTGLPTVLSKLNVNPDTDNIALSGHSRGGKTAFALALGRIDDPIPPLPKFKALIGIDPVAGFFRWLRADPKILDYIPGSFNMSTPVAVIGTGYGNKWKGSVPPFAPNGLNHLEFFNESKPPACYFVAKDYGHIDMLDDWIANRLSCMVKSGTGSKDLMRKGVGGVVVAFLRAYLGASATDDKDLNAILNNSSIAPIVLDPVNKKPINYRVNTLQISNL